MTPAFAHDPARLAVTGPEAGAPVALAQSTYDELVQAGLSDTDIMAFASEVLSLVASGVRTRPAGG